MKNPYLLQFFSTVAIDEKFLTRCNRLVGVSCSSDASLQQQRIHKGTHVTQHDHFIGGVFWKLLGSYVSFYN
jgi:hypothetical protein